MTAISAKTVRAEADASLEAAKQESGVEFGEMGELKAREGSSGDGVSRPALTVSKRDMKAMRKIWENSRHAEVPRPARALNNNGSEGGLLAEVLLQAGGGAGAAATIAIALSGVLGLAIIGTLCLLGALLGLLSSAIDAPGGARVVDVAKATGKGFLIGALALPILGAVGGNALGRGIEIGAHKVASWFKKGSK